MSTVEEVTSWQVRERFCVSRAVRKAFCSWCCDPRCEQMVAAVLGHRSIIINQLTASQVMDAVARTRHPLCSIRKADIQQVRRIRDWHNSFAGTQVLHFMTEELGFPPTWDECRQKFQEKPYRQMWLQPAQQIVAQAIAGGHGHQLASEAMRWRLGNFYYMFFREQYAFAVLREARLPVRQHILADALFKADAWVGNVKIDLFVANRPFRLDQDTDVECTGEGRRTSGYQMLANAQLRFEGLPLQFGVQRTHGNEHLTNAQQLQQAATSPGAGRIMRLMCSCGLVLQGRYHLFALCRLLARMTFL